MKYAIVAINTKLRDDGTVDVRRALIEYKAMHWHKRFSVYEGTRLIAWDPYFDSSRKYELYDDGYSVMDVHDDGILRYVDDDIAPLVERFVKRYHSIEGVDHVKSPLFEAATDDEAKDIFWRKQNDD